MSGIAGIVHAGNDRFSQQDLAFERMLTALAAKGPDGRAGWREGPVSLGLALFRSTPEQVSEFGPTQFEHVVVVADARLDERAQTLDALSIERGEQARVCDSELIARAYVRWGTACVEHLRGDFAFALWDRRERVLLCARDLFAIRPFYYAEIPHGLVFGSNFACFRESGVSPIEVDPVRVYDALTYKWLEFGEPDRTYFRGLRRLPAGNTLTFRNGRLHVSRYGELRPSTQQLPRDSRELPLLFKHHFEVAVDRRLRRVGPAFSMLSGGLDSGAIVCSARTLLEARGEARLHTCSVLSDPPWDQETAYVRAVQAGGNLVCHDLTMARLPEFTNDMIAFVERSDHVPPDYVAQLWLACARVARDAGARIMLTGETGDFALGVSCDPLVRTLREGALWESIMLPLREARAEQWSAQDLARTLASAWSQHLQQDVLRWLSPSLYWALRKRRHRVIRERQHRECLEPLEAAEHAEMLARFARVRLWSEWADPAREDHLLAGGADHTLGGVGEMWDRVCSAQGIEARHPILDRDLVEFCMAVPWRERMAGGQSKALLRRSGILPPGHANQGFMYNANSNARLAMSAGAISWLAGCLENLRIPERSWFRSDYVRELRRRFRASVGAGSATPELLEEAFEVVAFDAWAAKRPS